MNSRLDNLIAEWSAIGAAFAITPDTGGRTPDIERMLLETARLAPRMARLFIMAATWLHEYGDLIAKHRLRRLIADELEPAHRPTLGLLLDIAQGGTHPPEFASVIRTLPKMNPPRPLFEAERATAALAARAERRASATSRQWGLWCEDFEFKTDALRPAGWIMAHHPGLITRADFRGDLRASVLAALTHDPGAGHSEVSLAASAGGSRAQVRSALRNLELTGRVHAWRADGANRREIALAFTAPSPSGSAPRSRGRSASPTRP